MKLTQEKVFEIISNLRSQLPSHGVTVPYPDENSVGQSTEHKNGWYCKSVARYQLKQYKTKYKTKKGKYASAI